MVLFYQLVTLLLSVGKWVLDIVVHEVGLLRSLKNFFAEVWTVNENVRSLKLPNPPLVTIHIHRIVGVIFDLYF